MSLALLSYGYSYKVSCATIRYDTIAEFNVDSKAECDYFNLAHETKTKTPVPDRVKMSFVIFDIRAL